MQNPMLITDQVDGKVVLDEADYEDCLLTRIKLSDEILRQAHAKQRYRTMAHHYRQAYRATLFVAGGAALSGFILGAFLCQ